MPRHPSFSKNLTAWYKKNARDLPWRRTRDPYKIWISEIMLQQTTVVAVIPYYKRWIKTFPDIQSAAKAPLQKVLKAWQGLGYYQRAKNFHQSARMICRVHNGKIPRDPLRLRELPGFGSYTVGAVLSIAFNQRHPIIDANVRRVVMRQLAIKGRADALHDPAILKFLDQVMPQKGMNAFNQALMELGALICRNREPLCLSCPVKSNCSIEISKKFLHGHKIVTSPQEGASLFCKAYKKGIQEIIPAPKNTVIKNVEAVVAVIERQGRFFIQKRSSKGLLADLWEFPGGKIEKGESARAALSREVAEELGVAVRSAKHIMNVRHCYTQFRVNLHVWSCCLNKYPAQDKIHKWVRLKDLSKYPVPSGSAKIVERLQK